MLQCLCVRGQAPEQLDTDSGPVTEKVDIWAWACIAVEMFAGAVPWKGVSHMQILGNVCMKRQTPQLPEDAVLPAKLRMMVEECFAFDPAQRPTAAQVAQTMSQLTGNGGGGGQAAVARDLTADMRAEITAQVQAVKVEFQQALRLVADLAPRGA